MWPICWFPGQAQQPSDSRYNYYYCNAKSVQFIVAGHIQTAKWSAGSQSAFHGWGFLWLSDVCLHNLNTAFSAVHPSPSSSTLNLWSPLHTNTQKLTRSLCWAHSRETWSWICMTCAADERSVSATTASVPPVHHHHQHQHHKDNGEIIQKKCSEVTPVVVLGHWSHHVEQTSFKTSVLNRILTALNYLLKHSCLKRLFYDFVLF